MTHLRSPRWSTRLDLAPGWGWIVLQCVALAPAWAWMAGRLADGSDDPLGLLALLALIGLLVHERKALCASPRPGWMAVALASTVAATLLQAVPGVPPLAAAFAAVLALACGLMAVLPLRVAVLPVIGLAVLALPLLSSLQFYAGYPLRVVTAEASRWLLSMGFSVTREGSSLLVDGRLVIVDAPCSGVQMAWFGYFTACVVALAQRLDSRTMALRLPVVGLCVLAGNVLRNSVLVAAEGAGHVPPEWGHQAVGLVVLALVCTTIAAVGARPQKRAGLKADRLQMRVSDKVMFALLGAACLAAVGAQVASAPRPAQAAQQEMVEWPTHWDGALLRPQALSAVESRFARRFPGTIARLTDGRRVFVMRRVDEPTRMLHPAADCYRGLGYRLEQARLERDAQERLWRCFRAQRKGAAPLKVCERIVDARGLAFTDTSAWYWAATTGQSQGPWQAVTVAEAL